MSVQTYRENREKFSVDELRKHDGQWVAFSADGSRIVASADDLESLHDLVLAAGEDPQQVGWERIEFENTNLGGSELL